MFISQVLQPSVGFPTGSSKLKTSTHSTAAVETLCVRCKRKAERDSPSAPSAPCFPHPRADSATHLARPQRQLDARVAAVPGLQLALVLHVQHKHGACGDDEQAGLGAQEEARAELDLRYEERLRGVWDLEDASSGGCGKGRGSAGSR